MYAIVKTGGKQYRVKQGETLLVERLPDAEGATVDLLPLLIVDGDSLTDGDGLDNLSVQATIVEHVRGPKLRVVKFKPKRGYTNRNGHRQDLTRIQISSIGESGGSARSAEATSPAASTQTTAEVSNGA